MARSANYFGALDDLEDNDETKFRFAPSILESKAGGAAAAAGAATLGSAAESSAASAVAPLSLKAVAEELFAAEADMPKSSAAAAWDFSSFAQASTDTERQIADDALKAAVAAEQQRRLMEEHLKRTHEAQRDELREKVDKYEGSHKAKARKLQTLRRGDDYSERLTGKVARRNEARKRVNRAKHDY